MEGSTYGSFTKTIPAGGRSGSGRADAYRQARGGKRRCAPDADQGAEEFHHHLPVLRRGLRLIVHTRNGKVVNIEGDPDHPINHGALCPKGGALFQIANNERRLQKVMYRAPRSDKWEEKSWDWALERIAKNMKETRDKTFKATEINKKDNKEYLVNRTEGLAFLGGAGLDNEECYLWSKFGRAMGVANLEHQARL